MSLFDPFADSTRDPTVQRQAELVVLGDAPLSPLQRALVGNHYAQFRLRRAGGLPGMYSDAVTLADGTTIRIESNNNLDRVIVQPVVAPAIRYELLPAFWLDAPANGDPIPDPLNSATWAGMPFDPDQPPGLRENFWRNHPGNTTWYDAREDAPTKGLVLSWWGLGKTRYGAHIFSPSGMAKTTSSGNYDDLYCNGVKIGEFSQNVWSACIGEVDGVLSVIVLTAAGFSTSPGSWYAEGYGSASADPDMNTGHSPRSITFTLHHAALPAEFKAFQFRLLEFTAITTKEVKLHGDAIDVDGTDYWFHAAPLAFGPNPAKFNASGSQGILHIEGYVIADGETVSDGTDLHYLPYIYLDPATGDLYVDDTTTEFDGVETIHHPWWWSAAEAAIQAAAGASGSDPLRCDLNRVGSVIAYDYEQDTLRAALVAFIDVGLSTYQYRYTTKHGIHGSEDVSLTGVHDYSICGDLRVDYVQFVKRRQAGGNATIVTAYLAGTSLTWTSTTSPSVAQYARMSVGFEGCDTSFDGRLIVDRSNGEVRVFADGDDVSGDLADPDFKLQDVQYPVLCGPLARLDGTPAPARQYVAGEPP